MGKEGGACTYTLSQDKDRMIPGDVWEALAVGPDHRFGKVCADSDLIANWVASITKLCGWSRMCTYEEKKALKRLARQMHNLQMSLAARVSK